MEKRKKIMHFELGQYLSPWRSTSRFLNPSGLVSIVPLSKFHFSDSCILLIIADSSLLSEQNHMFLSQNITIYVLGRVFAYL